MILVAVSSRISRTSFTRLGELSLIHAFITDDGISETDVQAFERHGIEVLVATRE